ncbi:MAG: hypothetical protein WA809_04595, partial [Candidatus Dormiibacterota bacterium]
MNGLARSGPDPTSNPERVNDFLAHCKAKGLSPRTYRDAYGYPLTKVLLPAYFGQFDQPDRLKAITHFGAIRSLRGCYRRSGSDAVRILPL